MYLALPDSTGKFPQSVLASRYSSSKTKEFNKFRLQDYHPLWFLFPEDSATCRIFYSSSANHAAPLKVLREAQNRFASYNPDFSPCEENSVWASAVSLAATQAMCPLIHISRQIWKLVKSSDAAARRTNLEL